MNNTHDIEVPKWDIALANLMRDEYARDGAPLTLADIRHLASHYAIRFDDIMATLLEMVVEGEWEYLNTARNRQPLSREDVNKLYVNGRLNETDLQEFTGGWRPAGT